MALLTNINGKFSVSDAGAVTFNNAFTFPTADGNANYVLQTNGSGQIGWAENGSVTGSGSATRVAFWSSGSAITSDADLYWDNTNKRLGIGVASPVSKLHVEGAGEQWVSVYTTDITGAGALNGIRTQSSTNGKQNTLYRNTANNLVTLRAGTDDGEINFIAGGSAAERMRIDSSGDVGIGTVSPQTTLDVKGAASALNAHFGQGANNSSGVFGGISLGYSEAGNAGYRKVGIVAKAIGDGAARQELHFLVDINADGNSAGIADSKMMIDTSGNVGIGTGLPGRELTVEGAGNVYIKIQSRTDNDSTALELQNTQHLWTIANDDTNNDALEFRSGGVGTPMVIEKGGNVGINDVTPSYKLDVDGTIRATGDVIAYSDVRVKENIKTIDNSLEKVSKLRGVEFNKIGDDVKSIGVVAQEIEKVIPEVVKEDDKGMKSVAYGNISGLLIEAIKELKAEIEELKLNKCNCNK